MHSSPSVVSVGRSDFTQHIPGLVRNLSKINNRFDYFSRDVVIEEPCETLEEVSLKISRNEIDPDVFLVFDNVFYGKSHDDPVYHELAYRSKYNLVVIVNVLAGVAPNEPVSNILSYYDSDDTEPNLAVIRGENAMSALAHTLNEFVNMRNSHTDYSVRKILGEEITHDESFTLEDAESAIVDAGRQHKGSLGRLVSVTSPKGGVGKSTTSILLSFFLRKYTVVQDSGEPPKVLLIDLDTNDSQIGAFIDESNPNIYTIYAESVKQGGLSKDIIRSGIIHKKGLSFILGARSHMAAERIPSQFYDDVIDLLREDFDFIIADTSIVFYGELLKGHIYPKSDNIILVTEPLKPASISTAKWIQEVTNPRGKYNSINYPSDRVKVFINKYSKEYSLPVDTLKMFYGNTGIASVAPSSQDSIGKAINAFAMDELVDVKSFNRSFSTLVSSLDASQELIIDKM